MFENMVETVKVQTITNLMRVRVVQQDEQDKLEEQRRLQQERQEQAMQMNKGAAGEDETTKPAESEKIGRNAPCPCGSGKKYKKCCGRVG